MGFMRKFGRMKFGAEVAAKNISWNVSWMRRKTQKVGGPVMDLKFPNTSTEVQASLGWSGRALGESIAELEKLINQNSKTRIYDLVKYTIERLGKDFVEDYRLYLWQDGNQSSGELMGILSMFGGSSTPNNGVYNSLGSFTPLTPVGGTNAQGGSYFWSCQNASPPTYAGLSTALGAKVNSWTAPTSSAWPVGTGDYGYNYYTPLIVDYNSKAFTPDNPSGASLSTSGVQHSWPYQFNQACNRLLRYLEILQGEKPDVILCDPELLAQAADSTLNKQRFVVEEGALSKDTGIEVISYNGAKFASEYGVPAGFAAAIPFARLNFYGLHKQLIGRMEDTDIVTAEDLYRLSSYNQMWAESPAYFGGLVPATAAGT
jgi:hypothetical protein